MVTGGSVQRLCSDMDLKDNQRKVKDCVKQWFSNVKVDLNHLGILLKCTFWSRRSEMGLTTVFPTSLLMMRAQLVSEDIKNLFGKLLTRR